jgi:hypothetical protein
VSPEELGEVSAETVIDGAVKAILGEMEERIKAQDRVIEDLKGQVRVLTGLHAYKPGASHCLPPSQDLATRWLKPSCHTHHPATDVIGIVRNALASIAGSVTLEPAPLQSPQPIERTVRARNEHPKAKSNHTTLVHAYC